MTANRRKPIFVTSLLSLIALAVSLTASADSSTGERLFNTHCAACHGTNGKGGVGVPLSLPSFINSVDDTYLKKSIEHGRPGRIMPGFSHLPKRDIRHMVDYMRSWTGVRVKDFSRKTIKGDPAKGKLLYQQYCAGCHGAKGEGGHGTGVTFSRPRDLPILAPSLNNEGFLAAASDEMIKATLMSGRAGTPMISYRKVGLGEQDIDNIVSFVRSFEKTSGHEVLDPKEPRILSVESPFDMEKTIANLKQAVVAANMRLIRVQYLDEGFVDKGNENKKRAMVYSCGFNFLNEALKIDPRVGIFLPCRVTVEERNGKVYLMTVNPKRLAYLFNNDELTMLCGQMKNRYQQLLEEATF